MHEVRIVDIATDYYEARSHRKPNIGKIAVVARNLSPTVPSPSRGLGANDLEAVGAGDNRDGRHMQFLSVSINR